jgi:hypothetical protein
MARGTSRFPEISPDHPASLFSRAQRSREHLGIPAQEQARQHRMEHLCGHRRGLLHRLALLRRQPRNRNIDNQQRMGKGHRLGPLVSGARHPAWTSWPVLVMAYPIGTFPAICYGNMLWQAHFQSIFYATGLISRRRFTSSLAEPTSGICVFGFNIEGISTGC